MVSLSRKGSGDKATLHGGRLISSGSLVYAVFAIGLSLVTKLSKSDGEVFCISC